MDVWAVNAALSAKRFPADFCLALHKDRSRCCLCREGGLGAAWMSRRGSRAAAARASAQGRRLTPSVALGLMHSYKRTTRSPSPPQPGSPVLGAGFLGHLSYETCLYPEQGQGWGVAVQSPSLHRTLSPAERCTPAEPTWGLRERGGTHLSSRCTYSLPLPLLASPKQIQVWESLHYSKTEKAVKSTRM